MSGLKSKAANRKNGSGNGFLDEELIRELCSRLREGGKLRKKLPGGQQLFIDRQLPYIFVYRRRESPMDDWGTAELITEEASFFVDHANDGRSDAPLVVQAVARELSGSFGAFLIIEVWSGEEVALSNALPIGTPEFKIFHSKSEPVTPYMIVLAKQLSLLKLVKEHGSVVGLLPTKAPPAPPGLKPLMNSKQLQAINAHLIGIEVAPIYREPGRDLVFPSVLKSLQKRFSKVLEKTIFEFMKRQTTMCPPNYLALGRRSLVQSVWQVDRMLTEVASGIDFLLLVTPTNTHQAFEEFKKTMYRGTPNFLYHPPPFDPVILKRQLYKSPVERIEDPTLAQMFREQQFDIESRITMVAERGKRNFLYSSLQLYERPSKTLVALATKIMESVPEASPGEPSHRMLTADEFAEMAEAELEYYRAQCPDLESRAVVRADVPGVLVSQGDLLIGKERKIYQGRARALLSHEVGTHIVTNYNGRAQQFSQLRSGLPGYDELQEPLAVLAEYLVGGLSPRRMRQLAARVLAVHWLVDDATFADVFKKLTQDYGFPHEAAFLITMRVFRGGGFTKDVVYLRGLVKLLKLLSEGLDFEMLFVGKFGISYLPIVRELMFRKILIPAKMRPHFMDSPESQELLAKLRKGATVIDLISNV